MTVSERIGRNMAQGAMNQISEAFEPPWWLGLVAGLAAFIWGTNSGKKKDTDERVIYYIL